MKNNLHNLYRTLKISALAVFLAMGIATQMHAAKEYYYFEDFSSMPATAVSNSGEVTNNGWIWNCRLSRDIIAYDTYGTYDTSWPGGVVFTNGRLFIFGRPNNGDLLWNNWYVGDGARFDPQINTNIGNIINATPEDPFGYTVIRYTTSIDSRMPTSYSDDYELGYVTAWLAEDNNSWDMNDSIDNFIYFYDKSLFYNTNTYGYFYSVENDVTVAKLTTNVDGIYCGNPASDFFKRMDNNNDNNQDNSIRYGASYENPVTRPLGIRMTTDGSKVRIYVNFNPTNDSSSISNAWILVTEKSASIANDLVAFLGTETSFFRTEAIETAFDNFLIRSVTSNMNAVMMPINVMTNTLTEFKVYITNQSKGTNNSGIGELYIVKPDSYLSNWILDSVSVSNIYGNLGRTIGNLNPALNNFSVTTNAKGELYIRFNMTQSNTNQIVTNDNSVIMVTFKLRTPVAANADGESFAVYADCVKHADTGRDWVDNGAGIKYATTGRKKAVEASANSMKVKVYTAPQADAAVAVSLNPYYEGASEASYIYRLDTSRNTGAPDISSAAIAIPDTGFSTISNIKSLILGSLSSTYIYKTNFLTNVGAGNYIYINYAGAGLKLAGNQGFDKITYDVYGTADLPISVKVSNYTWVSYVNSSNYISRDLWIACTNTNYSQMAVTVIGKSPDVRGSITPANVAINREVLSNVIENVAYTVLNNGETGNDVVRVKIDIPTDFTNIWNLTSDWLGSHTNTSSLTVSNNAIWVSYTNAGTSYKLLAGSNDVIRFKTVYQITNVQTNAIYGEWTLYADNENSLSLVEGAEYQPSSWGVWISPPDPKAENMVKNPVVYTSSVTNVITNTIWNTSPLGVNLKMARIELPVQFTNIISVTSSHLSDSANVIVTNRGGTNTVYLYYQGTNGVNDGNGLLLSVNENPVDPDKDVVVITTVDKIDWDTFTSTNYLLTNLTLATRLYKTNADTTNTDLYADGTMSVYSSTNFLSIQLPPIDAGYRITPNLFDTTTSTNVLSLWVTNRGMTGNRISQLEVTIDSNILSNFVSATSAKVGSLLSFNTTNTLVFDYSSSVLNGGMTDVIDITFIDKVDGMNYGPVIVQPVLKNDREKRAITNVVDGLATLSFEIPKPKGGQGISPLVYYSGTNRVQEFIYTVTNMGSGSDIFQKVRLDFPAELAGQIAWVKSSWLGRVSTNSGAFFVLTSSNVTILYTNKALPAFSNDQITLHGVLTNGLSNIVNVWSAYAFNGFQVLGEDYFGPLTNALLGSTNTYSTEEPSVEFSPNAALTTDLSNVFVLNVKNGSQLSNREIRQVRLDVPSPYELGVSPAVYQSGRVFTDSTNSNQSLLLFYDAGFGSGSSSKVQLTMPKAYINYPTNVVFNVYVDYSDGGSYRSTVLASSYTNHVEIALPAPSAYASVTPNEIGKDSKSSLYQITITNYGVTGNNILMAKIIPPTTNAANEIMTNITLATNLMRALVTYTNGYILVDYSHSNTNIPSQKFDRIVLRAYDEEDLPGFSANWKVYVNNTTNVDPTNFYEATELLAGDLAFEVIQLGYRTEFSVTPNELDTSEYSNRISVVVNNTGDSGNDVSKLRIWLPTPFSTNQMQISTVLGQSWALISTNGTNGVEITYASNRFVINTNDTISFTLKDDLDLGNTNVWIKVEANFVTSEENYASSEVKVGTNQVAFVMPSPQVRMKLLANEAFTSQRNVKLQMRMVNEGKGSNRPQTAKITLPQELTNGVLDIDAGIYATNWSLNNLELTLYLSNFAESATNTLILQLTNRADSETNLEIAAVFDNGLLNTNALLSSTYDMTLKVVTPPSGSVTPSVGLSTDYTNQVVVIYENNSGGSESTRWIKIMPPAIYTNILSAVSVNGTALISNGAVYVSNYSGGSGLAKKSQDSITLMLQDSLQKGSANANVWGIESDNGTGLGSAREKTTGSLVQSLDMPSPTSEAYLETEWFYVATGVPATNRVVLHLTNLGNGADTLNIVEVVLPLVSQSGQITPLTNIVPGSVDSLWLENEAVNVVMASNVLQLIYTNELPNGLPGGAEDEISFDLVYDVQTKDQFPIGVYVDNGSLSGLTKASIPTGKTALLKLEYEPQKKSDVAVISNSVIYTLDTNASILLQVENWSTIAEIEKIQLEYDPAILTLQNVVSSNSAITTSLSNGILEITYASPLAKGYYQGNSVVPVKDVLTVNVAYQWAQNTNMPFSGKVLYSGTVDYETARSSNNISILVPDFGRVKGVVLPLGINPSVQLKSIATGLSVTNSLGTNQVTATADSAGAYVLDYVPEGVYHVVFSTENYKDYVLSNISVVSNAITNIGTNVMRHASLNARSDAEQQVSAQLDSNSYIIVPADSLLRNFSVDIWLEPMTNDLMQSGAAKQSQVKDPANPDDVTVYHVEMFDVNNQLMTEQEATNDITLVLHYDEADIVAQGWNESKLGIYYWRPMGEEWVRLGGKVDTLSNTVTVKVSYLHSYYAIFGEDPGTSSADGFVNVRTEPKVFTPSSDGREYKNVKISIGFTEPHDSYEVKIYDVRGNLVRSFTRSGEYAQGEVYWDGYDSEGYLVRGGVYIYRVIADGKVFSGTIIVAR